MRTKRTNKSGGLLDSLPEIDVAGIRFRWPARSQIPMPDRLLFEIPSPSTSDVDLEFTWPTPDVETKEPDNSGSQEPDRHPYAVFDQDAIDGFTAAS